MFKKTVKIFFISVIALICGAMILRIAISMNKSVFKSLEPTEAIAVTYAEKGGDLRVLTHKFVADFSEESKFTVYAFHYVPEANEVQLTVRINRSAEEKDGPLDEIGFSLRNSDTEQIVRGTVLGEKDWLMYRFYRVSFSAEIEEGMSYGVLLTRIGAPIDEFVLHHKDQEFKDRNLTKSEEKAIAGWKGEE